MSDQRITPDRRKEWRGGLRLIDLYHHETGQPLTPLELANMTGLSYPQVIEDIRHGELIAVKMHRGATQRVRYLILWENARAWCARLGFFAQLDQLERLEKLPPKPAA